VIPGPDASIASSNLQLTSTAMSPVEDSRKHRQRTAKVGCGNVLTGDSSIPFMKFLKRLAMGQHRNVTCGTFAEASSADRSQKKGAGMFLPVHWVFSRLTVVTAGVFSNTLMSPV